MRLFYTIGIFFLRLGIAIAAPFNAKAALWQRGRRGEFDRLSRALAGQPRPVWIHSASLGEYEQARPIIERIKKQNPETRVLATFFSPSGYEIRKNDTLPDYVFYLPLDFPRNVRRFLGIVNPQMAVFVKYEYWYNYLHELSLRNIPFYHICAIFRPSQYLFRPIGRWFAAHLRRSSGFFVQNEESAQLLKSIGIQQCTVCGDTRFDRVHAIASQVYTLDFVEQFRQGGKLMVAGSTWEPDEQLLAVVMSHLQGYELIVAPHEISRSESVVKMFRDFRVVRYSEMKGEDLSQYDVLVLDTIGMLSKVYKYSTLSYVGGAFKTGLHNILEAAVFGVPLFFGPKYQKFNEAVELVQRKGAFSITSAGEMERIVRRFDDSADEYDKTCAICRQYVEANIGAGDKIYNIIKNSIQ
ncbi:MAG: 3-deoxy-D-manno-octulosonic acid transferase [Bacteroidales bacterium]|nr:3-deoxy-D-manno-octulosonic acid transferase [Bacteroidales bacterium]